MSTALDLRTLPYDHPDAAKLISELQQYYRQTYGGYDNTPVDPARFAPPAGHFVVGYLDGQAVACGGWRISDDVDLLEGDVEVKRMYVAAHARGRGLSRVILAELERTAADAGHRRIVLETGLPQSSAIKLYESSGYQAIPPFGIHRCSPNSRCFAKTL